MREIVASVDDFIIPSVHEGANPTHGLLCTRAVRELAAVDVATLTRERDAARAALTEKEGAVRELEKKAAALTEDVMKLELDNDR